MSKQRLLDGLTISAAAFWLAVLSAAPVRAAIVSVDFSVHIPSTDPRGDLTGVPWIGETMAGNLTYDDTTLTTGFHTEKYPLISLTLNLPSTTVLSKWGTVELYVDGRVLGIRGQSSASPLKLADPEIRHIQFGRGSDPRFRYYDHTNYNNAASTFGDGYYGDVTYFTSAPTSCQMWSPTPSPTAGPTPSPTGAPTSSANDDDDEYPCVAKDEAEAQCFEQAGLDFLTVYEGVYYCVGENNPKTCEEECQVVADCYEENFGDVCKAEFLDAMACYQSACVCTVESHEESFALDLSHAAKKNLKA